MARASDGTDVPVSPVPASSSNMGSPDGSLPDLAGTGYRASTMEEKINEMFIQMAKLRYSCSVYPDSKIASRRFPRQWLHMVQKSQILSKSLAALQPVLPHWKRMQRPSPVAPARQDLGTHSNMVTAPQPLGLSGPMAQGHLMTKEKRGVDLIFSQAPKMNIHGVPSYYGSHVSNTTLGLRIGSITFGKSRTYQPVANPSEFIAKQVPHQPGLHSKQEPCVRTLWPDIEMMVFPMKLISPYRNAKTHIAVRQSKPLEDWEIGKQFAPLWKVLAEKLEVLFPEGSDTGAFIIPALGARSQVLSIKDRRNGVGKPVFKLAPFGSGQLFALVAPDLCVPGVLGEVLQQVISQASTANV